MNKLTIKQKKFADEYIITGNAYKSAIEAGYSINYAKGNVSKLLENERVKTYIDIRLKELDDQAIAKQDEVLRYLSSIMRGKEKEEILKGVGEGAQTITQIDVSAKDRLKAAELLGKRYGSWIDRKEVNTNIHATSKLDKIIEQLTDDDDELTEDDL